MTLMHDHFAMSHPKILGIAWGRFLVATLLSVVGFSHRRDAEFAEIPSFLSVLGASAVTCQQFRGQQHPRLTVT